MRLLAFDAERVDGVEQVDAEAVGEHAHQRENLIEVGFHLKRARAVFQRLRQLAVGDVAVRDEDDGIESGGAGIGRHGCGRVAGGDARHALAAESNRLRDAAGHAVVFERSGGIEALVFERQPIQAAVLSGARRVQQRRVAFAKRDDLMVMAIERQQFAIAPDAALVERVVRGAAFAPGLFAAHPDRSRFR